MISGFAGKTSGAFTAEPFDVFKALGEQGVENFEFGMPVLPSTTATTNNVSYNVSVNAGVGTNGTNVGKAIVEEILRFERASGNVWTRAAV
jgi:hypothetical protein